MKLSVIDLYDNEKLLCDGEFERLDILKCNKHEAILSFLENEKFLSETRNKNITCIICKSELVSFLPEHIHGIIVSTEPRISFWKRFNELQQPRKKFKTRIGNGCKIHPMAYIAENNVVIGNNVVIEEFVSIKENVTVGDNCIIRAGCILGGQGYEFKRSEKGILFPVEHFGGVIIGDDVELQQLVNVSRSLAPDDDTVVGSGTKVDALVFIAHAVKIGHNCNIIAGVVLGGSVCIGDNVWIGPNATVSNGLHIGDYARISLGSVVTRDVEAEKTVSGNFAIDHKIFIENIKASSREKRRSRTIEEI